MKSMCRSCTLNPIILHGSLFVHMSGELYTGFALSGWRLLIANKRNHACISCLVLVLLTCVQDSDRGCWPWQRD